MLDDSLITVQSLARDILDAPDDVSAHRLAAADLLVQLNIWHRSPVRYGIWPAKVRGPSAYISDVIPATVAHARAVADTYEDAT